MISSPLPPASVSDGSHNEDNRDQMLGTKSNFADQNKIVELNKIDKISQPVQVPQMDLVGKSIADTATVLVPAERSKSNKPPATLPDGPPKRSTGNTTSIKKQLNKHTVLEKHLEAGGLIRIHYHTDFPRVPVYMDDTEHIEQFAGKPASLAAAPALPLNDIIAQHSLSQMESSPPNNRNVVKTHTCNLTPMEGNELQPLENFKAIPKQFRHLNWQSWGKSKRGAPDRSPRGGNQRSPRDGKSNDSVLFEGSESSWQSPHQSMSHASEASVTIPETYMKNINLYSQQIQGQPAVKRKFRKDGAIGRSQVPNMVFDVPVPEPTVPTPHSPVLAGGDRDVKSRPLRPSHLSPRMVKVRQPHNTYNTTTEASSNTAPALVNPVTRSTDPLLADNGHCHSVYKGSELEREFTIPRVIRSPMNDEVREVPQYLAPPKKTLNNTTSTWASSKLLTNILLDYSEEAASPTLQKPHKQSVGRGGKGVTLTTFGDYYPDVHYSSFSNDDSVSALHSPIQLPDKQCAAYPPSIVLSDNDLADRLATSYTQARSETVCINNSLLSSCSPHHNQLQRLLHRQKLLALEERRKAKKRDKLTGEQPEVAVPALSLGHIEQMNDLVPLMDALGMVVDTEESRAPMLSPISTQFEFHESPTSPGTDLDMGGSEPSSPRKEVLVSKELLRRSMSPAETIAALGADCMSDAEMVEMSEYKAIYFAGLQGADRLDKDDDGANEGYDDDQGDYLMLAKDHLLYQYECIRPLGQGAFGAVYECYDHKKKALGSVFQNSRGLRTRTPGIINNPIIDSRNRSAVTSSGGPRARTFTDNSLATDGGESDTGEDGFALPMDTRLINPSDAALGSATVGFPLPKSVNSSRPATNIKGSSVKHVAVKIIRNRKRFTVQAESERDILKLIAQPPPAEIETEDNEAKHTEPSGSESLKEQVVWDETILAAASAAASKNWCIATLIDSFRFRNHTCFVFPLYGLNLFDYLKYTGFVGFSVEVVKSIAIQVLHCLVHLHKHKVIHCDLKPENIVFKYDYRTGVQTSEIVVIDFGSSCKDSETMYSYIQSRFYRAPETMLGLKYGLPIDMWSFATILPELYTACPSFPGEDEHEELLLISEVLGNAPDKLVNKSPRKSRFFGDNGLLLEDKNSKEERRRCGSRHIIELVQKQSGPNAVEQYDPLFVSFLSLCLQWDPAERPVPYDALTHPWLSMSSTDADPAGSFDDGGGILYPSVFPIPGVDVNVHQTPCFTAPQGGREDIDKERVPVNAKELIMHDSIGPATGSYAKPVNPVNQQAPVLVPSFEAINAHDHVAEAAIHANRSDQLHDHDQLASVRVSGDSFHDSQQQQEVNISPIKVNVSSQSNRPRPVKRLEYRPPVSCRAANYAEYSATSSTGLDARFFLKKKEAHKAALKTV